MTVALVDHGKIANLAIETKFHHLLDEEVFRLAFFAVAIQFITDEGISEQVTPESYSLAEAAIDYLSNVFESEDELAAFGSVDSLDSHFKSALFSINPDESINLSGSGKTLALKIAEKALPEDSLTSSESVAIKVASVLLSYHLDTVTEGRAYQVLNTDDLRACCAAVCFAAERTSERELFYAMVQSELELYAGRLFYDVDGELTEQDIISMMEEDRKSGYYDPNDGRGSKFTEGV